MPGPDGPADDEEEHTVQIDCDTCEVRALACGDCVVTFLLGAPPEGVELDQEERAALDVLAASGLIPPLRLVSVSSGSAKTPSRAPVRDALSDLSGRTGSAG